MLEKNISRRLFLAAASISPALGVMSVATAADRDPIFAAIKRHRFARARLSEIFAVIDEAMCAEGRRIETDAEDALSDAASRAEAQELEALTTTIPTTLVGFLAALKYLVPYAYDEDCYLTRFVEAGVKSTLRGGLTA